MESLPEWKQKILENSIQEVILESTVTRGCRDGDNVAGTAEKISILTKTQKQLIYFSKRIPSVITKDNDWIVTNKIFRRENEFYKTVVPKLATFLKTRSISNYKIPIPKYICGFNDDKQDFICMEDLQTSGFQMANKFKGFNLSEMTLLTKEIAKFHALTYTWLQHEGEQIIEQDDSLLPFNTAKLDPAQEANHREDFQNCLILGYQVALKFFQKQDPTLHEHMSKIPQDKMATIIWETYEKTDSHFFPILMHGDLWLNNILIRYDPESKEPLEIKLIDFQFTRRGNIFYDLSMLFFTSTTPEFREKHLDSILNLYYEAFTSFVEQLGSPQVKNFSFEFVKKSFRSTYLSTWVFLPFVITIQLGDDDDSENRPEIKSFDELLLHKLSQKRAFERLQAVGEEMIAFGVI